MQPTGWLPLQTPDWQVSVWVHALPSLQAAPSALARFGHWPVALSQVPASWHWSEAVQPTGLLPTQTPDWQASVGVQALPSLHSVPLDLAGFEHRPVAESQLPATWHWSDAEQTTGTNPLQEPPTQISTWVQASPSTQGKPLALAGLEHSPVEGAQVPASWHGSEAVQVTRLAPLHAPDVQVSVWVQPSPSLQVAPSALTGWLQTPLAGSHVPAMWH